MLAKMAANEIRIHATPTRDVLKNRGWDNPLTQAGFRPVSHRSSGLIQAR